MYGKKNSKKFLLSRKGGVLKKNETPSGVELSERGRRNGRAKRLYRLGLRGMIPFLSKFKSGEGEGYEEKYHREKSGKGEAPKK